MSEKYKHLKVKDLQELLQKIGAPHTGKKEELIERLVKHDETKALELESLEEEFGDLEDFDDTKLNIDDLTDPELRPLQQQSPDGSKEPTSTPTKTGPITKKGSGFTFNPIVFEKKPSTSENPDPATAATASTATTTTTTTTTTTDAERRIERAKRFGVQINEKTRQELRAERFGVQHPSSNQDVPKKNLSDTPEEEEKKRKRAERFAVDANKKPKN